MGQKVHPHGIRLGIIKEWSSKWYVDAKEYASTVCADLKVREFLEKKFAHAAISNIIIERPAKTARVIIKAARPGVIIGKSGKEIDVLRAELKKIMGVPVQVAIEEVRKADVDARLVAAGIAAQLEKRVSFRKAMKRSISSAMRAGAEGIKICVSGRLGGADIARTEWARQGRIPLHTFRADISYALAEAHTTYGIIGVKVWICRGEVLGNTTPEEQHKTKSSN